MVIVWINVMKARVFGTLAFLMLAIASLGEDLLLRLESSGDPTLSVYEDMPVSGVDNILLGSLNLLISEKDGHEVDSISEVQALVDLLRDGRVWGLVNSVDIGIGVENPNGATGNALSVGVRPMTV